MILQCVFHVLFYSIYETYLLQIQTLNMKISFICIICKNIFYLLNIFYFLHVEAYKPTQHYQFINKAAVKPGGQKQ